MYVHLARQSVPRPKLTSEGRDKYRLRFLWYRYPPVFDEKKMHYDNFRYYFLFCMMVYIAFFDQVSNYIMKILNFFLIPMFNIYDDGIFTYIVMFMIAMPFTFLNLVRLFMTLDTWISRELIIDIDPENVVYGSRRIFPKKIRTSDILLFQVTSSKDMPNAVELRPQYSPLFDIVAVTKGNHAISLNRNTLPLATNAEIAAILNDVLRLIQQ